MFKGYHIRQKKKSNVKCIYASAERTPHYTKDGSEHLYYWRICAQFVTCVCESCPEADTKKCDQLRRSTRLFKYLLTLNFKELGLLLLRYQDIYSKIY